MKPEVYELHHVSLVVEDTERALRFYRDLLAMDVVGDRPGLSYPGAWLRVGGQEIHLLELPNPDPVSGRPAHGGRDRHIALLVSGLDELRRRLEAADMPYTHSRSGRAALFCRDPDGNAIELVEVNPE